MGAAGGESISGDGKWQMKGEASRGEGRDVSYFIIWPIFILSVGYYVPYTNSS